MTLKHKSNINMPSKKQLEEIIQPYSDEEYEKIQNSKKIQNLIDKLKKSFKEKGIDYDEFDPESIPKLDLGKCNAYPNQDTYMHVPGKHNTDKWLQSVREIYFKEKNGIDRVGAIRQVTSGWNLPEIFDFLNWLKFYESGAHMKYKFAKLWYENGEPGYFLQIKPDPVKNEPSPVSGKDIDFAREESNVNNEKKQIIEKQRHKIIGRLDSAEKLLRSQEGQIFSGKEFEVLLEAVYQLKKKIQMVNKVSTSTKLYDDMIIREANVLHKGGFINAADVLYSVAQTPAAAAESAQGKPDGTSAIAPAPAGDPSGAGHPGAPGGLPSMGPGMPQGAPSDAAPEGIENQPPGIKEFLEGMNTGNFTGLDDDNNEDKLEVEDTIDVDENDADILVTEAQAIPEEDIPMTSTPAPAALDPSPVGAPKASPKLKNNDETLEVTEDDIKPINDSTKSNTSAFDSKMDAMLADVTIADIVSELEDLAKVFKVREIPRRLSYVDIMLSGKNLSSYFPQLSEAQNKALESNNYISTRVEDILSKLRGSMNTKEIDLKGDTTKTSPELDAVKNKLQQDEDKEKQRKQMRKEQEAADLSSPSKDTPEVEIEEDLAAPAPAKPAAPTPKIVPPT